MFIVLSVLILIVCALMILVVLVQNSKGGGLAANFQSSNQVMGVRKTADFLEKSTWTLAVALVVFSMLILFSYPKGQESTQNTSVIERSAGAMPGPVNADELPSGE